MGEAGCWGSDPLWGWDTWGASDGDPLSAQRLPHKIRKLHSALERMLVSAAPSRPISPFPPGFAPPSQRVQGHRAAVEVLPPVPPAFSPAPGAGSSRGCVPCAEVPLRPQDPSWNHRVYRLAVAKLSPPIIPFVPLLLKGGYLASGAAGAGGERVTPGWWGSLGMHPALPGTGNLIPKSIPPHPPAAADMTFIHEGNRTLAENLINFEKMVSGAAWLPRGPPPWGTCLSPRPDSLGCRSRASPMALAQPPPPHPRQPGPLAVPSRGDTGQRPLKPEGTVFYQPGSKVGPGDSK